MPRPDLSTIRRRIELGRLLAGSLLETAIKAYGVGAVVAVALSDAETAGGKASDAVRAVPSLAEEWDQARYVVDHHEEIQAAVARSRKTGPHGGEPRPAVLVRQGRTGGHLGDVLHGVQ